ncbi:MAG: NAD-dependent epimerase/dehydratase family protein [Pseudonocardiaceae bacterium]
MTTAVLIRTPDGRLRADHNAISAVALAERSPSARGATVSLLGLRAVVTGGAGFIGSTVVDALVAHGADVLVIDDLSRGARANLERVLGCGVRLAELDIRDGRAIADAFHSFRPELVFDLAAQIDVRVSMDEPARDAAVNVIGSVNVFSAAHAAGVRRVVNTSTGGAIYGETDVVPHSGGGACRPHLALRSEQAQRRALCPLVFECSAWMW